MKLSAALPRRPGVVISLLALALITCGCTDRRIEPAREAIAEVEAALATAGTDPIKYVPGEVERVRDRLDSLKQDFAGEDYEAVLREAPAVLAAAQALPAEADRRESELLQSLQAEWSVLEPAVPGRIEAMRSRVQALAAGRVLPPAISRDDLNRATGRIDDAQALWERALVERHAQRLPEAVTLANQARELLDRVAETPGFGAPVLPLK
jgi:hypothetical protein